jgi:dual specificity protein kinase YAK1
MDQYAAEHRTNEQPSKQYFKQTLFNEIIMEYSFSKKNAKQSDIEKGKSRTQSVSDEYRNGTPTSVCRFR